MKEELPVIGHVLHQMDFAGAEVLAADLARRLQGQWRFVFLCLDGVGAMGESLRNEGFEVVELGRKPGVDWRVCARIRKAVKKYNIRLLHAHQYSPFFYAAASRLMKHDPPVLFTEHGRHYPDMRSGKRVFINPWLLKKNDQVTAVGQFVRRALIDNEGISAGRTGKEIDVIYNGIDPDKFEGGNRKEARKAIDAQTKDLIVMQVARFHPVKDHATSIKAFVHVVDEIPKAKLVLVGDGNEREAMEELAENLGVGNSVKFMGVRDDVNKLLDAADVFVLSSLSEGVSVTLLEAMAASKPIVATNVGGNAEVVEHGRNGLLSERSHADELAHNIKMLLRDKQMRKRMGEAGRNRLLKMFTQKKMHQSYERVYEEMLSG